MASTTMSSAIIPVAATTITSSKAQRKVNKVVYMSGLNSYGGLKAQNTVLGLGNPVCTEQCFANIVSSLRTAGKRGGGGALSSTCNAAAEIFRIAAIMNGLVLVGVAVGFVLLRIEATLEESE